MYLAESFQQRWHKLLRFATSVVLVGIWFGLSVPSTAAASAVVYSISPASGAIQPDSTVEITLSVQTSITLAGGSIHVTYANGSYAGFESANTTALTFVDYHSEQNDVVYICSNNNCPPGTYQIAKITVKAAASGSVNVTFTPKETADPQLNLVAADGTTGTYAISSSAPATPKSKTNPNKFTIPRDGSVDGLTPIQVDNEQFEKRNDIADRVEEVSDNNDESKKSFWTPLNVVLIGLGIGVGFSAAYFVVFRLFLRPPGPKGPMGPMGPSGGPGPTIYPGM